MSVWYGLSRFAARRLSCASSRGERRMAISCFAFPDFGRPTRRARFSSSFVDCGISEKSMRLSRIGFALFRACPARGDDSEYFFAIFCSPVGINQNEYPAPGGNTQSLEPIFVVRVFEVLPLQSVGIGKDADRLLERNARLRQIPGGFPRIPGEHINVYTGIGSSMSIDRIWKLPSHDALTSI